VLKEKLSFIIPKRKDNSIHSVMIDSSMFEEICSITHAVQDSSRKSIAERVYFIEQNILDYPTCLECNNKVKWLVGRRYFANYCCNNCVRNSEKVLEKFHQTLVLNNKNKMETKRKNLKFYSSKQER
jgi:hypothetical protein